jgi:predicted CoA-substrate-specific enzyme activase
MNRIKECLTRKNAESVGLAPLVTDMDRFLARHHESPQPTIRTNGKPIKAYLGIDIGSISTNLAVLDDEGRLLSKRYLMTAGRPIEAVRQGLSEIGDEIGHGVEILSVATTGSGRYMIADFVGADIVKNEITAQATAAAQIDPQVDTIFEIGGQDSKYISLRDGIIIDFEMNKACAAGTGSFLEEQAEKLDISIKDEYSKLAFDSSSPCALGERCTVFMENSLVAKQQQGAKKEDLVSGLAYSIVQNYINRVVNGKAIGEKIFFQGGVAFNKSVVAAFERYTGREIIVPPNHDVTGAIGMALIAQKHYHETREKTTFKGFDLSKRSYELSSFECKGCSNLCEINKVKVEGETTPLYYGSRCEKYDVKRKAQNSALPNLFEEREILLTEAHNHYLEQTSKSTKKRLTIAIPRVFFFQDTLPYWTTLLWEMGFNVVVTPATTRQIVNKGTEAILAETCFPVKVAHGHIKASLEFEPDAIFLPSFINLNEKDDPFKLGLACPYVQTIPYLSNVAFPNMKKETKLLTPPINLSEGPQAVADEIYKTFKSFGVRKSVVAAASKKAEIAQRAFAGAVQKRGRQILSQLDEKALVIIGRSYNSSDAGLNLEIPKKLRAMNVMSIPMDFLSLNTSDIKEIWPTMYWRSGQRILSAAEVIRDNPNLFPLYISNFSCGPDSFILRFFKESMGNKPFLHIEIDEHSADAGAITRCEAFLDSINSIKVFPEPQPNRVSHFNLVNKKKTRRIFVPRMCDHAIGIVAAFQASGINAELMPPPDRESVHLGRTHVSGKECYPCAVTTGDMIKITLRKDFDPETDGFFMPSGSGPCRFGQYNILQKYVLSNVGLDGVPIFAPNQDSGLYKDLGVVGSDFSKRAWRGILTIDIMQKCLHETRPYETTKGETEEVYNYHLSKVTDAVKGANGSVNEFLKKMQSDFKAIKKTNEKKPLIGMIGEIFVRLNAFSNENLIKKIERLGGEVWLAPMEEWINYINAMGMRHATAKRDLPDMLNLTLTRFVQRRIEHDLCHPFERHLKTLKEPTTNDIMKKAAPYVHESFEGETILSMGKAVDFVQRGASGVVSAIPFGCMPGVIVDTLLRGLKKDTGIPCLSIPYDGNEDTGAMIQLEAFMYQATEYMNDKKIARR